MILAHLPDEVRYFGLRPEFAEALRKVPALKEPEKWEDSEAE